MTILDLMNSLMPHNVSDLVYDAMLLKMNYCYMWSP
jgi:hypothetical protein